tara:strand:+ start:122 stop:382 length:261 start_codon:yes stop_codon:yes gene_type:complete
MKLYDYKLKENLRGDNLLIIIIDLGDGDLIFNNVDIYIQDNEEIEHAMKIIKGDKNHTNYYNDCKLSEFLEEIYCSEIDPYRRGEN